MYRNPVPTVDVVVIHENRVLLVKRGIEPFKGKWVIPGGHVDYGETVEAAAIREVLEETSIKIELVSLLGVYSGKDRDPRKHTVTTVFIGELVSGEPAGGDDAAEARWHDLDSFDMDSLAFDHSLIMRDAMEWLRNGGTYWTEKQRKT